VISQICTHSREQYHKRLDIYLLDVVPKIKDMGIHTTEPTTNEVEANTTPQTWKCSAPSSKSCGVINISSGQRSCCSWLTQYRNTYCFLGLDTNRNNSVFGVAGTQVRKKNISNWIINLRKISPAGLDAPPWGGRRIEAGERKSTGQKLLTTHTNPRTPRLNAIRIHTSTHRCVVTGWSLGLYRWPQLVVVEWWSSTNNAV